MQAICNLGWADKGRLWVYSTKTGAPATFFLNSSKYIHLAPGKQDFFAASSSPTPDRFEITAHHHSEPQKIIARASVRLSEPVPDCKVEIIFEGDSEVWGQLPRAFLVPISAISEYRLLLIRESQENNFQKFDWYEGNYDQLYQGIVGVTEIPNSPNLVVSIQRDSNPVVYDPKSKKATKKLTLGNRGGNPDFSLRITAKEFWVNDYDTIVKLDSQSLEVKSTTLLQKPIPPMARLFIGELCFDAAEKHCLVARPFSGDAILLEADSMKVVDSVELGHQPLDVALLADGTVIGRDWKTGDFLYGRLKHKRN